MRTEAFKRSFPETETLFKKSVSVFCVRILIRRRFVFARDTVTTSAPPLLRFAWSSTRIRSLSMTRAGAVSAFLRPRYRHNLRPAAPALRSEFDSHTLAQYDTGV